MKLNIATNFKSHVPEALYKPTLPEFKFEGNILAIDTECTGLHWPKDDKPFGLGLAWYDTTGKISTIYYDWPVNPYSREIYSTLPNYFSLLYTNPDIIKVFANAKFDMHMIEEAFGILPKGPIDDVLVAAWCCNTLEPSYALKKLADKYVKITRQDEDDLVTSVISARASSKAKNLEFNLAASVKEDYWLPKTLDHTNNLCEYYCKQDCVRTLKLRELYISIMEEFNVRHTFDSEMKLMLLLYEMEKRGIRFNKARANKELLNLNNLKKEEEKFIRVETNRPKLNLASPKQLIEVFYNSELGNDFPLPIIERTEKGAPSTSTGTLKKFRDIDIIFSLLKFRGYKKGAETCVNYANLCIFDKEVSVDDLPDLHNRYSIHTNYNQINTCTGRLSSSKPNLQNVSDPAKSNGLFVSDARGFFGPREGYVWVCIDYRQLEARIFSEISQSKEMIDTFNDPNVDPFTELGTRVFGKRFSKGKRRKLTKNIFYCKIFCGGPEVLSVTYEVTPLSFAVQVMNELSAKFPTIKEAQNKLTHEGYSTGFIRTLFNRRIDIDPNFAYRAASYITQGSAADLMKRAMLRCSKILKEVRNKVEAYLVLSVHDELVFEVRKDQCYKWFIRLLKEAMEDNSDILKISTPVEIEITDTNWSNNEKREIKLC